MDLKGDLNNPMVQSVLGSCGITTKGSQSPISIEYQVFVDVFLFRGLHVLTDRMSLDCPKLSVNLPLVGEVSAGQVVGAVGNVAGAVADSPIAGQVGQVVTSPPVQGAAGQVGQVVTSPPVQNAAGQVGSVLSGVLGRRRLNAKKNA